MPTLDRTIMVDGFRQQAAPYEVVPRVLTGDTQSWLLRSLINHLGTTMIIPTRQIPNSEPKELGIRVVT